MSLAIVRKKSKSPVSLDPGSDIKTIDESSKENIRPNVIRYSLSDKSFINLGWTVLPKHKFMKKEKVYLPLGQKKTSNDWIYNNENKALLTYKSGEKLAEFQQKSISKIFYKNGKAAIDVHQCEINGHRFQRFVIRNDENNTLLAILDTLGRGAVSDEYGNIRLRYNQLEGILLDSTVGTPRSWKWFQNSEKPEFENVMFDTYIQPPDEEVMKIIKKEIGEGRNIGIKRGSGETASESNTATAQSQLTLKKIKSKPTVKFIKAASVKNGTVVSGESVSNYSNLGGKTSKSNSKKSSNSEVTIFKNYKVFKNQHIKSMTLKLNNYLVLKVINRRNMYVTFLHDCWLMKIDIGVELTNECIESYLIEPKFASTDYDVVLSKVNVFMQTRSKSKKVQSFQKRAARKYFRS